MRDDDSGRFIHRENLVECQQCPGNGQLRMSRRKAIIQQERTRKQIGRLFQVLRPSQVNQLTGLEIGVIGGRAGRCGGIGQRGAITGFQQFEPECVPNCQGDLFLDLENITELAFKRLRPKMGVGPRLDQLCGDAHPIAGLADRSLKYVAYVQKPGNFGDGEVLSLEGER